MNFAIGIFLTIVGWLSAINFGARIESDDDTIFQRIASLIVLSAVSVIGIYLICTS